jgi:hypothetical protein
VLRVKLVLQHHLVELVAPGQPALLIAKFEFAVKLIHELIAVDPIHPVSLRGPELLAQIRDLINARIVCTSLVEVGCNACT